MSAHLVVATTVWHLIVSNAIVSVLFMLGAMKRQRRSCPQRNSMFVDDEADASGDETEDEDLNESDFENDGADFINDDDALSEPEIERCDDDDPSDANLDGDEPGSCDEEDSHEATGAANHGCNHSPTLAEGEPSDLYVHNPERNERKWTKKEIP